MTTMEQIGKWLAGWTILNPEGHAGLEKRVDDLAERVGRIEQRMDEVKQQVACDPG